MSGGSTVLEVPKIDENKIGTLVELLKEIQVEGRILEHHKVKYFDNRNVLLSADGKTLYYLGYPDGVFKLSIMELEEIRERLDLKNIDIPLELYNGEISHLGESFALYVRGFR